MVFSRNRLVSSLAFLVFLGQAGLTQAQDNQDNQPHITPRGVPAPTPRPTPKPKPAEAEPPETAPLPDNQQAQFPQPQVQGESSSKDSQIDFDHAPRAAEPSPSDKDKGDNTFLPYDPHRADKDVEVGNYYLRLKNYRAALERFNDALHYKPKDAEATFGLATTQEKLELLAGAYQNYQEYLRILPGGPHAKECEAALKRIQPHLATTKPAADKQADHDIDVGETYLSKNNFAAARSRFEEALQLAPENPRACYRLAQSLQGLRLFEPARLYYQKYLELDPRGLYASDAKKAIADITAVVGK
jgi:tetratricopeptide (TPR) repeat protein